MITLLLVLELLLNWVHENALKANPDQFHLVTSIYSDNSYMHVDKYIIKNSYHGKLLGATIDNGMSFAKNMLRNCVKLKTKNSMPCHMFHST